MENSFLKTYLYKVMYVHLTKMDQDFLVVWHGMEGQKYVNLSQTEWS